MNQTKLNQINLPSIPHELKNLPYWVCWKSKEIIKGQKPTKIPINPHTGGYAKSDVLQTWGSFDDALKFYNSNGEKIDGIGFVVSPYDPFTGIDIDHCRDPQTSIIEPWAIEIIKEQKSYTEITPSGTGIRIFVKGKVPRGRKKGNIEVYSYGRFFTVTGNHLEDMPITIEQRQTELDSFYNKYFGNNKPQEKAVPKPIISTSLTDREIIEKATRSKNGDKFQKLWKGDWTDYPSQSEADLAFCQMLAFWTGNNQEQMDCLFRQSGLIRDKWDEKHGRLRYGQITINKAIEGTTEIYTPSSNNASHGLKVPTLETVTTVVKFSTPLNESTSFPENIMSGVAGNFAGLFSQYIESPQVFLYFAFLCCLGSILSGRLILKSERQFQPRYYILLLGESADERKSTAIDTPTDFFKEYFPNDLHTCWGVGSAEGLQLKIEATPSGRLLLCFDEFKALIGKCKIEGSILLPALNTLFEKNFYESRTKNSDIQLNNAHLSILGASTTATYENLWTSQFIDIGFPNRLFIVPGAGGRKHPIPKKVPYQLKEKIVNETKNIINLIGDGLMIDTNEEAREEFEKWYLSLADAKSVHTKRLDTYALRLMPLLAVNDGKTIIDLKTVQKTVKIMDWQRRVREEFDPIDATNEVARMEEKIRRRLKKYPHSNGELKHYTKVNREGIWVFNMAIKNLSEGIAKEIQFNKGSKKWELIG